ncbi:hypothetical protein NC652_004224 [Populus alba x Populus x berolinensis]|nr:hypothetical protein NC652_004224 [Populus alba x Populus x berolinensis]
MPPPDNSIAGRDMAGAMIEALADQLVQYQTGKRLKDINDSIKKTQKILKAYFKTIEQQAFMMTAAAFTILHQVGIVGIGVSGKTTISQKIFNNSKQLVDRFVKRVWVSISQIVSEIEIMKTTLKQLDQYVNGLDMAQTLPKIKRLLENKNCLAVIDDAVPKAGETERVQGYQRGRDGVVA